MPKKGRQVYDPAELEKNQGLPLLLGALDALYGNYQKTFEQWGQASQPVPPCFILVCNNTSTSRLLYDYISGYWQDEGGKAVPGKLPLFSNFDGDGQPCPRARTILVDSSALESGEKLPDDFRKIYAHEIDRFRRQARERGGALAEQIKQGKEIDDATLLREVMNTVGRPGALGGDVRCVVSVSMLTEGWDANNVTHILGVRAFGTQLLCEQVIGRALRRRSYELNENGLFGTEYADVLGIPFDFTAEPVVSKPAPPADSIRVNAVRPERDLWEIEFPRVVGYRVELPKERIRAEFTDDSTMELDPLALATPTETKMSGIAGKAETIGRDIGESKRRASVMMELTKHCLMTRWDDAPNHLYGQMKRIVGQWMGQCLKCSGGAIEAHLLRPDIKEQAAEKIFNAVIRGGVIDSPGGPPIAVMLDPYSPTGSTASVNFQTSKKTRWQTMSRCHLNYCIYHAEWEAEFCRVAEAHPKVRAYVKNYGLGFEVPYSYRGQQRAYVPDFILKVDDGNGDDDLLNLIVEIKGQRDESDKAKSEAMSTRWIPGINRLKAYGRWGFVEIGDVYGIEGALGRLCGSQAHVP